MFNINTRIDNNDSYNGNYEGRNHQDNFYSKSAYNDNFQYCRCCDKHTRFQFDRCTICKSN